MRKIKRKWIIPGVVIIALIIARIVAPPIILKKINEYLATFSESYEGHIDDFDLSILRGAYRFEKFTLKTKAPPQKDFVTISHIDVSVAWREIFRGRILTDVVVTELSMVADETAAQPTKKNPSKSAHEASDAGRKLFPVEIERIEVRNSRLEYKEYGVFVDQIEGRLSHFTSTEENPISLLTLRGFFLGRSAIKVVGDLDLFHTPSAWSFSAEVQQFKLAEGNDLVLKYVPLTFKKGVLDLYAEIKSEKGRISGYLKPFLKEAEVVGDDKDFKSIKHFGVEITVAFLNILFRSGKDHVVATKFLFSYENKKFDWNLSEMITELFKNGYEHELARGTEGLLTLKTKETKQRNDE